MTDSAGLHGIKNGGHSVEEGLTAETDGDFLSFLVFGEAGKLKGLFDERGGAFNAPPRSFRPIRINTGCARNRRPDWSRNHPGRCARSSDGPH